MYSRYGTGITVCSLLVPMIDSSRQEKEGDYCAGVSTVLYVPVASPPRPTYSSLHNRAARFEGYLGQPTNCPVPEFPCGPLGPDGEKTGLVSICVLHRGGCFREIKADKEDVQNAPLSRRRRLPNGRNTSSLPALVLEPDVSDRARSI